MDSWTSGRQCWCCADGGLQRVLPDPNLLPNQPGGDAARPAPFPRLPPLRLAPAAGLQISPAPPAPPAARWTSSAGRPSVNCRSCMFYRVFYIDQVLQVEDLDSSTAARAVLPVFMAVFSPCGLWTIAYPHFHTRTTLSHCQKQPSTHITAWPAARTAGGPGWAPAAPRLCSSASRPPRPQQRPPLHDCTQQTSIRNEKPVAASQHLILEIIQVN